MNGPSLQIGVPTPLFQMPATTQPGRNYSVSGDGRFLVNVSNAEQTSTPITVILNWAEGLKK